MSLQSVSACSNAIEGPEPIQGHSSTLQSSEICQATISIILSVSNMSYTISFTKRHNLSANQLTSLFFRLKNQFTHFEDVDVIFQKHQHNVYVHMHSLSPHAHSKSPAGKKNVMCVLICEVCGFQCKSGKLPLWCHVSSAIFQTWAIGSRSKVDCAVCLHLPLCAWRNEHQPSIADRKLKFQITAFGWKWLWGWCFTFSTFSYFTNFTSYQLTWLYNQQKMALETISLPSG